VRNAIPQHLSVQVFSPCESKTQYRCHGSSGCWLPTCCLGRSRACHHCAWAAKTQRMQVRRDDKSSPKTQDDISNRKAQCARAKATRHKKYKTNRNVAYKQIERTKMEHLTELDVKTVHTQTDSKRRPAIKYQKRVHRSKNTVGKTGGYIPSRQHAIWRHCSRSRE
jgi:hypothetical protein